MKPDIHPKYQKLTIITMNGEKFDTMSTYDKGELLLDVDFRKHPAWSGGVSTLNEKASAVAAFQSKFGNMSFSSKKKTV